MELFGKYAQMILKLIWGNEMEIISPTCPPGEVKVWAEWQDIDDRRVRRQAGDRRLPSLGPVTHSQSDPEQLLNKTLGISYWEMSVF